MSENFISENREETIRFIDESNNRIWKMRGIGGQDLSPLIAEVWEKSTKLNYNYGIARCMHNTAMGIFIIEHNNELAIKRCEEALAIFKILGNKKWIANVQCTLGIIHNSIGNSEAAVANAVRSVDFYENNPQEIDDRLMVYYTIGTVYKDLKRYDEAENYFLKGVKFDTIDDSIWSGRIYTGLAGVYSATGKYADGLKYSLIALEKLRRDKNDVGESRALTDIGVIYKKLGDYKKALENLEAGLKIRENLKTFSFIISSQVELADLHKEQKDFDKAILHYEKAKEIAIQINQELKLAGIYKELSAINKALNNYEKSIFYLEQLIELNACISKKELESRLTNFQDSLVKEKQDEIERLRNVELKNAHEIITAKNTEIIDSIKYAKRIQDALLPSEKYIDKIIRRN